MRPLSASELLGVWERGMGQHPVDRALTLLAACSGELRDSLASLSIGRRDALLLQVYEQIFGATLAAFAECPRCRERLEYAISARDMAVTARPDEEVEENLSVAGEDFSLRIRLPNSIDLAAVSACVDVGQARRLLAERCIVEALHDGNAVSSQTLPDSAIDLVAARLAEADPQAEMLVDLACAACRHSWQVVFDIESFLWSKVAAVAKRLMREVHVLARAYGWREPDILALSSFRRQSYLEMTGACLTF